MKLTEHSLIEHSHQCEVTLSSCNRCICTRADIYQSPEEQKFPLIKAEKTLTLTLWNSTQLPALLRAMFSCSPSIPAGTSVSANRRPRACILPDSAFGVRFGPKSFSSCFSSFLSYSASQTCVFIRWENQQHQHVRGC